MKKNPHVFYRSMLVAVCLALIFNTIALAAPGDLDTTFSGDGKIVQSFGGKSHKGGDVAVQSDGKVVVAGTRVFSFLNQDIVIARYNIDGSLDTSFHGDGRQIIDWGANIPVVFAVAVQTDGKIVIGGTTDDYSPMEFDGFLLRLNPNGTRDAGFGQNGIVVTDYQSKWNHCIDIVLMGNKIVAVGYEEGSTGDVLVYRYNANGSLDTTFSGDGILSINFGGIEVFNSVKIYGGKIYAAGSTSPDGVSGINTIIARINSNGTLDTTFSGDGKVQTDLGGSDIANSLVISSGKIVVVGSSESGSTSSLVIARYTASGVLDATFSGDGKLISNLGFTSAVLYDVVILGGRIVAVGQVENSGNPSETLVVRYGATGNLDTTFGSGGFVTTDWGTIPAYYGALAAKDQRIYTVGSDRGFLVAAYTPY